MKSIEVKIQGISGLLMHKFPMEPIEGLEKKPKEEQAEFAAYRSERGDLYIPSVAIQRTLIGAATYSKGKGRGSLQKVAAACIFISPEYVSLGTEKYEIDSRPVVVPATRGRVIRHRPKLTEWSVTFTLDFDETLITPTQMRKIVDDAGSRVGLLDFRPATKGPFGRFMVVSWKDN